MIFPQSLTPSFYSSVRASFLRYSREADFWLSFCLHVWLGFPQVVSSVQTLGRRGSGSSRLRKYANYAGVVIVDEVTHTSALLRGPFRQTPVFGVARGTRILPEVRLGRGQTAARDWRKRVFFGHFTFSIFGSSLVVQLHFPSCIFLFK